MSKVCFVVFLSLVFVSCKKNIQKSANIQRTDCEVLESGLLNKDQIETKSIIDKLIADLLPNPAIANVQDPYGQKENFYTLAQRINDKCNISATVLCYGCERSYPECSLITIHIIKYGTDVKRTLRTSINLSDFTLRFVNVF